MMREVYLHLRNPREWHDTLKNATKEPRIDIPAGVNENHAPKNIGPQETWASCTTRELRTDLVTHCTHTSTLLCGEGASPVQQAHTFTSLCGEGASPTCSRLLVFRKTMRTSGPMFSFFGHARVPRKVMNDVLKTRGSTIRRQHTEHKQARRMYATLRCNSIEAAFNTGCTCMREGEREPFEQAHPEDRGPDIETTQHNEVQTTITPTTQHSLGGEGGNRGRGEMLERGNTRHALKRNHRRTGGTIRKGTTRRGTIWKGTTQRGIIWKRTTQRGTIRKGTTRNPNGRCRPARPT